jgi:hypothetical protein
MITSVPGGSTFMTQIDLLYSNLDYDLGLLYQAMQSQKITIGSGAVEATIKQIGRRIKISGAGWNRDNLAQVLKHRCAYLNLALA